MGWALEKRYALQAQIAEGATGTVWRAQDRDTGAVVAIKILRSEAAREPDVVAAFRAEAQVLAEVNHPGVVRPRDFIAADGELALVMDLVGGIDLRQQLRNEGTLRPMAAVDAVGQAAEALAAVHAAGIVHGDVKPGNILVPADGSRVRLADFGVAHRVHQPAGATHATPEYVAPEVVAGVPPEPSSDVYSLGLMLYEVLTGRSPFRGGSVDEVLARHRDCELIRPAGLPERLWELVQRCTAPDPRSRPPAWELVNLLRAARPAVATLPATPVLAEEVATYRPRTAATEPVSPAWVPAQRAASPWARPDGSSAPALVAASAVPGASGAERPDAVPAAPTSPAGSPPDGMPAAPGSAVPSSGGPAWLVPDQGPAGAGQLPTGGSDHPASAAPASISPVSSGGFVSLNELLGPSGGEPAVPSKSAGDAGTATGGPAATGPEAGGAGTGGPEPNGSEAASFEAVGFERPDAEPAAGTGAGKADPTRQIAVGVAPAGADAPPVWGTNPPRPPAARSRRGPLLLGIAAAAVLVLLLGIGGWLLLGGDGTAPNAADHHGSTSSPAPSASPNPSGSPNQQPSGSPSQSPGDDRNGLGGNGPNGNGPTGFNDRGPGGTGPGNPGSSWGGGIGDPMPGMPGVHH